MTKLETQAVPTTGEPSRTEDPAGRGDRPRSGRGISWRWILAALATAAAGGAYLLRDRGPEVSAGLVKAAAYIRRSLSRETTHSTVGADDAIRASAHTEAAWDGLIAVDDSQSRAVGLNLVEVKPQTAPIKLELTGRTAYNPNSLAKVRSRFDALVERVHVELGQHVKRGDPLVDLFSTELVKAKNDYQTKFVQWQHDLRILTLNRNLVASNAISQQKFVDSQNDERKSHLEYATAAENLHILGVPENEIEPLIANLGDAPNSVQILNVAQKARMTLRSLVEGIIITRDVVPGSLYEETNVLLVIAPLEHLWVLANVYEVDQAKVSVGQTMVIRFPFLHQTTTGTVEYVSSEVSRETRAVQVRASIPNPSGELKSDMLVKVTLEVPPREGETTIPRQALIVLNGEEYVFVRKSRGDGASRFERRRVRVAQENSDFVVVDSGLKGGETVASGGSLILAQLFEEKQTVQTGLPAN